MFSFLIAIAALILGYIFYGRVAEKHFAPDDRVPPAIALKDGVDYLPMPLWKLFLIQLLNIAGTGPIFGALSGAVFGPVAYLWIVLGCIFAGAVHDYNCGMLSMRHKGGSISEVVGIYLGKGMKNVMRVFSVILLVMCGVVFTTGPAGLLDKLTNGAVAENIWIWIILAYYFIATFLPIDKVIGQLYPLFGVCLIVMAFGVGGSMLFSGKFTMPEVWDNFSNLHPSQTPIWPFMCVTVACGAISGFHATQSPMVARCCTSEKQGRPVFYGAMVAEGIIALVWAAAGVSCYDSTRALLDAGAGCSAVVYNVCQTTMGKIGAVLGVIGVVVCPISSGDTAYRSARLTIADWFGIDQADAKKRFFVTLPLLAVGALVCRMDYSVVWRYFSWSNQTLAMIALWTVSVYYRNNGKRTPITVIPALFMSAVSATYFVAAPECLGYLWRALRVSDRTCYAIAVITGVLFAGGMYALYLRGERKNRL